MNTSFQLGVICKLPRGSLKLLNAALTVGLPVASTQCWLVSLFLSTRTPKPFSAGLLSVCFPVCTQSWDCPNPSAVLHTGPCCISFGSCRPTFQTCPGLSGWRLLWRRVLSWWPFGMCWWRPSLWAASQPTGCCLLMGFHNLSLPSRTQPHSAAPAVAPGLWVQLWC